MLSRLLIFGLGSFCTGHSTFQPALPWPAGLPLVGWIRVSSNLLRVRLAPLQAGFLLLLRHELSLYETEERSWNLMLHLQHQASQPSHLEALLEALA